MRKLKNRELDELKSMGFGLWELKTLRNLINELAAENRQEVENGEAVKMFIADIENHYADYQRLRSKIDQLREDESRFRTLMVGMGPIGPAVSSYLSRMPTANDMREVIKLLGEYPKATRFDSSTAAAGSEKHSQIAVQTGSASSNQIDEQKDGPKTSGPKPNEIGSTASNAELVAYETDPEKKRDDRLRPPRPPSLLKSKRLLG
jgi:hypothetical protein